MSSRIANTKIDFYAILQVQPDADFSAIRTAYRRAALASHPDKGGSTEAFLLVARAFAVLSQKTSRSHHSKVEHQFHHQQTSKQTSKKTTTSSPDENCYAHASRQCEYGIRRNSSTHSSRFPEANKPINKGSAKQQQKHPKKGPYVGEPAVSGCRSDSDISHLQSSLVRLRALLQRMSIERRKAAIGCLDVTVRSALLDFMRTDSANAARSSKDVSATGFTVEKDEACALAVWNEGGSSSTSGDETSSTGSTSCDMEALTMYDLAGAIENSCEDPTAELPSEGLNQIQNALPARSRSKRRWSDPNLRATGLQIDATGNYYRAHIMLSGIELYTRYQPHFQVAVEHHMILAQIRHTQSADGDNHFSNLKQICNEVLACNQMNWECLGLRCFVRFSARSLIGAFAIISPVLPLDEAVQLRNRLRQARETGWPALRKEWLWVLQSRGGLVRRKKAPLSAADAEAYVDRARMIRQRRGPARPRFRCNAQEQQSQKDAILERRITRVAMVVKRILVKMESSRARSLQRAEMARKRLDAEAVAAKRKNKQELKHQHEKKWKWLNRKDITTEEIMRGPPRDLQ